MSLESTTDHLANEPALVDVAVADDAVPAAPPRPRAWLLQPVNLLLMAAALLPVVFVLSFISDRGVDMPLMDDWENAALIAVKTADGTLTLPDMFRQYVSHRMFFTNLYTAIMTVVAGWPIKFTLYFIVFQALLVLTLLGALFYRDQPRALPVVLVAFSVLLFSVRQNINWLLSTQTSWFFVLLFFLGATAVLRFSRPGWRPVLAAALLSVCGVFSTLHGFAAFPVLFLYMLMLGYRKPGYYVFWMIVGVLAAAAFMAGYDRTTGAPPDMIPRLLAEPHRVPLYLITYLGNPFVIVNGDLWPLAATIGVTGIVLGAVNAVYVVRRHGSLQPVATWVTVGLWALVAGLLTSIGRAHYFPEPNPRHPLLDRYVLPSTFLWFAFIALSVMALRTIARRRRDRFGTGLSVVNVGVVVVLMGLFGWNTLWSYHLPPFLTNTEYRCMQRFPSTRNVGCMTRGLLDTLTREELMTALNGMAIHQLAGFRDVSPVYTDIVMLDQLPRDTSRERNGTRFTFYEWDETTLRPVFIQPAPSVSVFTVPVPDTPQRVVFFSAVFVADAPEDYGGPPPDGIIFRVTVRGPDGETRVLTEGVYDPTETDELVRTLLPLNDFRGQTVELILQTDDRENPNADLSMWIDPSVLVMPE